MTNFAQMQENRLDRSMQNARIKKSQKSLVAKMTEKNLDGSVGLDSYSKKRATSAADPFTEAAQKSVKNHYSTRSNNQKARRSAESESFFEKFQQAFGAEEAKKARGAAQLLATTTNASGFWVREKNSDDPKKRVFENGFCFGKAHSFLTNFDPTSNKDRKIVKSAINATLDKNTFFEASLRQKPLATAPERVNTQPAHLRLSKEAAVQLWAQELDKAVPGYKHSIDFSDPLKEPTAADTEARRQYIQETISETLDSGEPTIFGGSAHAVAIAQGGDNFYIMDANKGVFSVSSKDVAAKMLTTMIGAEMEQSSFQKIVVRPDDKFATVGRGA